MTVRAKMFAAMISLAILVSLVYVGTTQGYMSGLFSRYERNEVQLQFQSYYIENGNTWENMDWRRIADEWERKKPFEGSLSLFSPSGEELFRLGDPSTGWHSEVKDKPIYIEDKQVGTVFFHNWQSGEIYRLKIYILDLMLNEAIRVAALTILLSIIIGLWLSFLLTSPLRKLMAAIGKITTGERDFQIPVTSKDEYGRVTIAFNEMTRQLNLAETSRKRLVADVAHELRTPLAIMQTKLEVIQEGEKHVAPEALLPIQDEIIRLTKLVDDLHQLTIAEAGKLGLDKKPSDLHELIARIKEIFQEEADKREIRLTFISSLDNPLIVIDSTRMRQVFFNLVANAIQYTPDGGSVQITATKRQVGDAVYTVVSVTDSGIGIPEDQLPYLFERFYRVEEARTRHTGGMGLGLAIANEFVKAHHGFIEVESKTGTGTTFRVYLP